MTSGFWSWANMGLRNGELLLALCSEFEMIVTNTMFEPKDERKTNWMHLVPDTGI